MEKEGKKYIANALKERSKTTTTLSAGTMISIS